MLRWLLLALRGIHAPGLTQGDVNLSDAIWHHNVC
jgi:hypothetical protein